MSRMKTIIPGVLLLTNATVTQAFETANRDEVLDYLATLMPYAGDDIVLRGPSETEDRVIGTCTVELSEDRKTIAVDDVVLPLKKAKFFIYQNRYHIEISGEDASDQVAVRLDTQPNPKGYIEITYVNGMKVFKVCRKKI